MLVSAVVPILVEGGRGYSGAGISRPAGTYATSSYSSGISTGGPGGYGQRYYAPRTSTGTQIYGSTARPQNRTASRQFARSPNYSGSYYVPRDHFRINGAGRGSNRKVQKADFLDPDPDRRVKSDFFIELYSLIHDSHVASFPWFSQNKFIREMLVKYQQEPRTIKAVTDFRTGKQVSDSWREIFHELLAGGPRIII